MVERGHHVMKICFVASSYPKHERDGAARFIRSLAEGITCLGHEVHVLIPHRSDLDLNGNRMLVHTFRYIWPSSLEVMGYARAMNSDTRLHRISYLLAPPFAVAEAAALARLHRRYQFDIIHAHWIIPNGVVAAGMMGYMRRPLVVSLHGSDIFFARGNSLLGSIATPALRRCNAVTACSPELQQGALALGAAPERLHLIAWGADPALFLNIEEKRWQTREVLGVLPDQVAILSLGRLVQKKGVAYFLRAFPQVLAAAPNAVCIVAGDGPERPMLEALARSLGIAEHVRFLGNISWSDVPSWLSASDVFVVPSIHDEHGNVDGLPTTILEAMAAGRPVVATQVAGIELAVQHGTNGLVVPEKDPIALGNALLLLVMQPEARKALGRNARQLIQTTLNWRRVAERFVDVYQESVRTHAQS